MNEQNDWNLHYQAVKQKGLQPATTLRHALSCLHTEAGGARRQAIDLGCGNGIDTLFLLAQGWDVLAIDREGQALAQLQAGAKTDSLTTDQSSFEEMILPPAMLVNASFSLPFCHPHFFPQAWTKVLASINGGGYFAGHFFGDRDSWTTRADMNFHSRSEVMQLLSGLHILFFEETVKDGKTVGGMPKHWHVYHVVARAPAP